MAMPYEEFPTLQEWLADIEDLLDLRAAKEAEHDALTVSLAEIENRINEN
ncbi:MAG: type II toxin-antitoxin system Phd/YefM family antitoxin [Pyrinomonadaceae bacterium]|nr:type II toxin-antitoxin system Phd/YefM family antitoxin [Pyrinomonadaceae bacterium]